MEPILDTSDRIHLVGYAAIAAPLGSADLNGMFGAVLVVSYLGAVAALMAHDVAVGLHETIRGYARKAAQSGALEADGGETEMPGRLYECEHCGDVYSGDEFCPECGQKGVLA